jgi:hypothetical protein
MAIMKRKTMRTKTAIPKGREQKKVAGPDNIQRREAIKRIALMALGGITGASLISSCEPPWYDDYSDYSDYYSDYYSRYSNNYYDYYSVYSAYWD